MNKQMLEAGKDADFVVWSGNPLSQFTRAEQTWVDGSRYFSIEDDAALLSDAELDGLIEDYVAVARFAEAAGFEDVGLIAERRED